MTVGALHALLGNVDRVKLSLSSIMKALRDLYCRRRRERSLLESKVDTVHGSTKQQHNDRRNKSYFVRCLHLLAAIRVTSATWSLRQRFFARPSRRMRIATNRTLAMAADAQCFSFSRMTRRAEDRILVRGSSMIIA